MKKILLFFFFLSFTITNAQLLFQDDFSLYTVNQELSGQGLWSNSPTAPNVGIGACLPLSASQPCSGTKIVAQPLSYLNYGSSANSIEIAPVKDGVARAITPIVSDGNLYLGIVLNITTAPDPSASPVDFLRVINSDQTQVTYRLIVKDAVFGYNIGIRKGASNNATVYSTDLYNYGESVLVIIKYSHLPSFDDDVVSAYVNPNYSAGEPATPTMVTASGLDQSGALDRVAFRLNYNVLTSMPTGYAGLVSTSTTWEGLTFQPLGVNQFESNNFNISSQLDNGFLNVTSKSTINKTTMNLYTITGSLVEKQIITIPEGNSQIGLSSKLSSGMYIVQLIDESGLKHSFKIIAQ